VKSRGTDLALALLVAVAAWLPSHFSRGGPYLRDDPWIVAENPALESAAAPLRFFTDKGTQSRHDLFNGVTYRPLMTWSLALDVARGGRRPEVFRTTNLALHALTSGLAFLLLLRLLALAAPETTEGHRRSVALGASLLFAAHPISAFALRYLSNRGLLLVTFFSYATLLSQLGDPDRLSVQARTFALACLALLCRENAATLPAAVLILEAGLRMPEGWRGWLRRLAPVLVALGLYLLLRVALGQGTDQFGGLGPTLSERVGAFLAQGWVQLGTYLPALAWPAGVRWDPPAPSATPWSQAGMASWALLGVALVAAIRSLRGRSVAALSLLLYPVTMIPTTLLMQPSPASFYRPYPGVIFAGLGVSWLLGRALGTRGLLALALPAALGLGLASHHQGGEDVDEVRMWTRARAYGLSVQGHLRAAEAEPDPARRLAALDVLAREYPGAQRVRSTRGLTRLMMGDVRGAAVDLEASLPRGPVNPEWRVGLLTAARLTGKAELARAAGAEPPEPLAVFQLAGTAMSGGHVEVADAALALRPEAGSRDWRVRELRGVVAHQRGRLEEAVGHYQAVLDLGATPPGLHSNLGLALRRLGDCAGALPHLEAALRENPGDQGAWSPRELPR
jgi:hypothetical protein